MAIKQMFPSEQPYHMSGNFPMNDTRHLCQQHKVLPSSVLPWSVGITAHTSQRPKAALSITKPRVVVLDNTTPHKAKLIEQAREGWAERGLTIFSLPRYSPHLNIDEHLWRYLKYFWLTAERYVSTQVLFYHVRLALAAFGILLTIEFSPFGVQLNDSI